MDGIKHVHKNGYLEHRKACQDALEAATSATANESEVKTRLSRFNKELSDLPDYLKKKKNYQPDLTEQEYKEFEKLWLQVDYHCAKFKALTLYPKACTERSKVDDSGLHGDALKSTLLDPAYLAFS